MKRITLNKGEIEELKETLIYERDTFADLAKNDIAAEEWGSANANHNKAQGLEIALERLETALNK